MSIRRILIALTAALLFFVPQASAQDKGQLGLVAAFPGSAGFHWQIADRFAIRVDGSYSHSTTDTESGSTPFLSVSPLPPSQTTIAISTHSESQTDTATLGITGLIAVHRRDALRLYVAPRFSMGWTSSKLAVTSEIINVPTGFIVPGINEILTPRAFEETSHTPGGGASFGGSVKIGERFAVFGEIGVDYNRGTVALPSNSPADVTRTAFGTRGGVGAMLLF